MIPVVCTSTPNGRFWFKKGTKILHRENGPAIEWTDGGHEWYINGVYHRDDGPAVEYNNGAKYWYRHGQRHRTDGPAIINEDGFQAWWINGKLIEDPRFFEFLLEKKANT